jgi:PHD/YefM family antitoxin component YafN of YafNO toxin-antitoxin module
MIKLPEILGVAEARDALSHILEGVGRGETFIIKGPKGKEALVVNADSFRRMQEAYAELVGELETMKILQDEKAMKALRSVSDDDAGERYSLTEVEGMVSEDET